MLGICLLDATPSFIFFQTIGQFMAFMYPNINFSVFAEIFLDLCTNIYCRKLEPPLFYFLGCLLSDHKGLGGGGYAIF